jgi:hypothetical protein
MNEDIGCAKEEVASVSIAGNQVVGEGRERDEAAIGADRGIEAGEVALIAGGIDADPLGRPGPAIMNEDIGAKGGPPPLVSPGTRLSASDQNATKRPLALIAAL